MSASTSPPPDTSTSSTTPPHGEQPIVLANRYRLERRLGQGGMAEVWLATDLALDRKVAVKWLKPTLATDAVVAERFRREAIAVARLNHPNIVAVHDAFEDDGRQAVVMQLVDGKSLRQILDVQTRLSPELTIHVGSCVAAALDAAHRAGFVHRDVKPGNILLTPDGRVLLTDFGIAKGLDAGGEDLTSDNVMMGTAKYLSPEQVRGKKLDGRADLYSLGLVLYECLAGRVPFLGETDADTALARLQRDPTDLGQLRPTLPRGLVELVHRLLSRNPNQRPPTGADLRDELAAIAGEPPPQIDSTPADPAPRFEQPVPVPRRRRWYATRPPQGDPRRGHAGLVPVAVETKPTRRRRRAPISRTSGPLDAAVVHPVADRRRRALLVARRSPPFCSGSSPGADDGGGPPTHHRRRTAARPAAAPPVRRRSPGSPPTTRGGDGEENDDLVAAAVIDDDPATTWVTECYADRFLGGKAPRRHHRHADRACDRHVLVRRRQRALPARGVRVAGETLPEIDDWGAADRCTRAFARLPAPSRSRSTVRRRATC